MKYIKLISLFLIFTCICLLCGCTDSESPKDLKIDMVEGVQYMVDRLSGMSDSDEIYSVLQEALDDGMSLDLTGVDVKISKPLIVNNQRIYGGKLTYVGKDKGPVLKISGKSEIDSVTITNQAESVGCGEGEYVGIWLSNEKGKAEPGTIIQSCSFSNVGTMVYAPKDVEKAACGITVENIRAENWCYRGVDMQSAGCSNNSYFNIYFATSMAPGGEAYKPESKPADCAIYLYGSSGDTLKQINVEHCNLKQPMVFDNCTDLNASTIHIEGVNIAEDGRGYLNFNKTSGRVGAVDFYWTRVYAKNNGAVVLYDAASDGNELIFETFLVKGINDPSDQDPGVVRGIKSCGIKFIARDSKYTNPYYVTINNYVPFSFVDADKERLEDFYSDYDSISFKKIGQLLAGGTTQERPTKRLCAGYTEYYDTTLGKLIKWNGKSWE